MSDIIQYEDFNQDYSSLLIGTVDGFKIVNISKDYSISEEFSFQQNKGVFIVSRLFSTSLIAFVTYEDPRKLMLYHMKNNTFICNCNYSLSILAVRMNRERLVVCVDDGIHIQDIRDMETIHKVEETPPNRLGIVALSSNTKNNYLAYPGSHRVGHVVIFDAFKFSNVQAIAAHDGVLAALQFNPAATLLATASEKGTVIRVFTIPSGERVMEFRRGIARCAAISSMSFSMDSKFLVVSSNTETLHVFRVELRDSSGQALLSSPNGGFSSSSRRVRSTSENSTSAGVNRNSFASVEDTSGHLTPTYSGEESNIYAGPGTYSSTSSYRASWMEWMGSTLRATTAYLPAQVSEMFSQDRAFIWAHLTKSSSAAVAKKMACLVQSATNTVCLCVASYDGFVHIYAIDLQNGGEATLIRSHNLFCPNDSQSFAEPESLEASGPSSSSNNNNNNTSILQSLKEEERLAPDIQLDNENEFPSL